MDIKEKTAQNSSLIKSLFEAGAHFGYSRTRRHPSCVPFLYGAKGGTDIIDLEKTCVQLSSALDAVRECAAKGKTILFVGTKPEAREAVEETATSLGLPYETYRWIGGSLTNFPEIRKRVERLRTLKTQKERGDLNVYSKKERRDMEDETVRLSRNFGGVSTLDRLPEALFIIDPRHEDIAVTEAKQTGVTVIALANSDCDVKNLAYPISGNDGARSSITLFLKQVKEAYKEGFDTRARLLKEKEAEDAKNAANAVAEVAAAPAIEKEAFFPA